MGPWPVLETKRQIKESTDGFTLYWSLSPTSCRYIVQSGFIKKWTGHISNSTEILKTSIFWISFMVFWLLKKIIIIIPHFHVGAGFHCFPNILTTAHHWSKVVTLQAECQGTKHLRSLRCMFVIFNCGDCTGLFRLSSSWPTLA